MCDHQQWLLIVEAAELIGLAVYRNRTLWHPQGGIAVNIFVILMVILGLLVGSYFLIATIVDRLKSSNETITGIPGDGISDGNADAPQYGPGDGVSDGPDDGSGYGPGDGSGEGPGGGKGD